MPQAGDRYWPQSRTIPHYVRYVDESAGAYLVYDLSAGERQEVDKHRAPVPSDGPHRSLHGRTLIRWSTWALLCVLLGGVGGLLLGVPVVLVALVRRAALFGRMRRWRQRHPEEPLPTVARVEYDRVRAALWQGTIAILLGLFLMSLLISHI